jgi:hypothetical protein
MHGEDETCIKTFVGRPEWERPLRRPRNRLEDDIKVDLKKVRW